MLAVSIVSVILSPEYNPITNNIKRQDVVKHLLPITKQYHSLVRTEGYISPQPYIHGVGVCLHCLKVLATNTNVDVVRFYCKHCEGDDWITPYYPTKDLYDYMVTLFHKAYRIHDIDTLIVKVILNKLHLWKPIIIKPSPKVEIKVSSNMQSLRDRLEGIKVG